MFVHILLFLPFNKNFLNFCSCFSPSTDSWTFEKCFLYSPSLFALFPFALEPSLNRILFLPFQTTVLINLTRLSTLLHPIVRIHGAHFIDLWATFDNSLFVSGDSLSSWLPESRTCLVFLAVWLATSFTFAGSFSSFNLFMSESPRLIPWDTSLFCLHDSHCYRFPIVGTWVILKFVWLVQDFCRNRGYIANCPLLKLSLPQLDLPLFLHCSS